MRTRSYFASAVFALIAAVFAAGHAFGQGTAFTYQGTLEDGGAPASGVYDFEFSLYDAPSGGSQTGPTVNRKGVSVSNGEFTVMLDFGAVFSGPDRFMEVRVRQSPTAGSGEELGGFTILAPRQPIASVPYAVRSLFANSANAAGSAEVAEDALLLGGVAAGQYVLTTDTRLSDARPPTAGSPDYIQNGMVLQATSNFNISGTGKAAVFDSGTQYNIAGERVLSIAGQNNVFLGVDSALGIDLIGSNRNSLFGKSAGSNLDFGADNSFFGTEAGFSSTESTNNSFFGTFAGRALKSSNGNSFFGVNAGNLVSSSTLNSFFGYEAGFASPGGSNNTLLGALTSIGGNFELTYATAIGAGAQVFTSNTIVLGRSDGTDKVVIPGLGLSGSTSLCRNSFNQVATCSSSVRYKDKVESLSSGSDILSRLRPVTFAWKDSGVLDLGLVAEEVAEIEPLLVTYNTEGAVEGVKYDRIGVVLVNVVKEQQKTIEVQGSRLEVQSSKLKVQSEELERQKEKVEGQKALIDSQEMRIGELEERLSAQDKELAALKALVCSANADAAVCK